MIAQNLSNLIAQTPMGPQKPSAALSEASTDIFADLFDDPREMLFTDLTKTDAIGTVPVPVPAQIQSAALTEQAAASDKLGMALTSSDSRLVVQVPAPISPTATPPANGENPAEAGFQPPEQATGFRPVTASETPKRTLETAGMSATLPDGVVPLANPRPMIAPPSIGGAPEPQTRVPDEGPMRNTEMVENISASATTNRSSPAILAVPQANGDPKLTMPQLGPEAPRTIAEADITEVPKPDQPAPLVKPEMQPPVVAGHAAVADMDAAQQLREQKPEPLSPPKIPAPILVEPAPGLAHPVAQPVTSGEPPKAPRIAETTHQAVPERQSPTETEAPSSVDTKPVTHVESLARAPGLEILTSLIASTDPASEMLFSDTPRSGPLTQDTARSLPMLTDHAPRVVEAIAQAARALSDRPVELTLNPEELGRVKLTLQGSDGAMSVQLTVERPETLELLRRHIDLLAADLRQAGYERLTFAFAGQQGQSGQHPATPADRSADNPAHQVAVPDPHPAHVLSLAGDGLDMRI